MQDLHLGSFGFVLPIEKLRKGSALDGMNTASQSL